MNPMIAAAPARPAWLPQEHGPLAARLATLAARAEAGQASTGIGLAQRSADILLAATLFYFFL